MSGGHLFYQQHRIEEIAGEIESLIWTNDDESLDQYGERMGNGYPPEIIEKFITAAYALRRAAAMVQRIDYLVSGDDGPDTFLRLWDEDIIRRLDRFAQESQPSTARELAEKFDMPPLSEENHGKNLAAAKLRY